MLFFYTICYVASLALATDCPDGLVRKEDCHKYCSELAGDFYCYPQPGCYCDGAKFLTNDGKCVEMFQCPVENVRCPRREVYSFNHTCPKTCENPEGKGSCFKVPSNRCECEPGFVRNAKNECISLAECILEDYECPEGLVPKCGNGKMLTCEDYDGKDNLEDEPIKECSQPTCLCPDGQFLHRKSNTCVSSFECRTLLLNEDCQKKNPNSYYSLCKPSSCSGDICTSDCLSGCFCKEGYTENEDGICV